MRKLVSLFLFDEEWWEIRLESRDLGLNRVCFCFGGGTGTFSSVPV